MLKEGSGFKKVYIACGRTDLRRGIDGLARIIRFQFKLDPYDKNTLFLVDKTRNIEDMKAYLNRRFGDCRLEPVDEILCSEDKIFVVYRLAH